MSKNNGEQQGAPSLEAKDVRVYLPPSWLTRRFVVFALIGLLTIGPLPSVVIITGADQFIRNKIDDWMSGPDLYDSIILTPEEYARLPVHWRQALAENSVRDEAEMAGVRELVASLQLQHMLLVDRVAPYEVQGYMVRDGDHASQHPIPTLTVVDFATLEDLGILQSVQRGHEITFDVGGSPNGQQNVLGTSVAMVMKSTQEESTINLAVTRFTEAGLKLIRLLRVPSDIRYFEWMAKKVEQSEIAVELWAIGTDDIQADDQFVSVGQIQRNTVSAWP